MTTSKAAASGNQKTEESQDTGLSNEKVAALLKKELAVKVTILVANDQGKFEPQTHDVTEEDILDHKLDGGMLTVVTRDGRKHVLEQGK